MEKTKFYKRCNIVSVICIILLIASALTAMYASGSNKIPLLIASSVIVMTSLLIGITATILMLGIYKPKSWPPSMPFPIICYPNKYAIVHLEHDYWVINYYETHAETVVMYSVYITQNKDNVYVFEKVYSNEKGYHNKRIS